MIGRAEPWEGFVPDKNADAGTSVGADRYAAMHNATDSEGRVGASAGDAATLPTRTLLEAIAKRLCVAVVYNRTTMQLAPHIVYTRHDELYVDAMAVERDGRPPKELKLGTFKLTGLGGTALTERPFVPMRDFDPSLEKYAGVTIFSVTG